MTDAKADLFAIMDAVPEGYDHLRTAILEGRIDGMYPNVSISFRRGCVKAHLAEFLKCDSTDLPGAAKFQIRRAEVTGDDGSPLERFVYGVRFMQTPENCPELKALLAWLDEWKAARDGPFEEDF